MFDNFYNIHEYYGLSCSSDCQTLSNIVVLKNKELDNFVFNDNSDNVRQYYKSCAQRIILLFLLSNIVNIVVQTTRGLILLYLTTIVTMLDNI